MRATALATIAALGASACAFDRGAPHGTLEATLDAHLATPSDRDLGDGFQRLASDWQVRVVRLDLVVDAVLVEASAEVAGEAAFDPASPPPGYGLCHGGHCHADDGRLVSYEEIAAELATAGGRGAELAAVLEGGSVPLVADGRRVLDCGDCVLEEGRLTAVRLVASGLAIELEVRDGRATPRVPGTFTAAGVIDLGPGDDTAGGAPGELTAALDASIDDDSPPVVALDLAVAPTVSLLDRVDFAALPELAAPGRPDGARDLTAASSAIRTAVDALTLDARVARRDD